MQKLKLPKELAINFGLKINLQFETKHVKTFAYNHVSWYFNMILDT